MLSFYDNTIQLTFDAKRHVYLRQTPDGLEEVDGVTRICGIIDKSEYLIPWACKVMGEKLLRTMPRERDELGMTAVLPITWDEFEALVMEAKKAHREKLADASDVGSAAHKWLETSIKHAIAHFDGHVTELTEEDKPDDARSISCGHAALNWMNEHSVQWLKTEHVVYSRDWNYAGTMDGLAIVDGVRSVIDWKSSNALRLDYVMQTAAYQAAEVEEHGIPVPDRWILRLGKENDDFEPWHLPDETTALDYSLFRICLSLARSYAILKDRMRSKRKNKP